MVQVHSGTNGTPSNTNSQPEMVLPSFRKVLTMLQLSYHNTGH